MKEITLSEYAKIVNIPEEVLVGPSRKKRIQTARQIYWLHLKSKGYSNTRIGKEYNRHRLAVSSGLRTINNLIATKDALIAPYQNFIDTFLHQETQD